MVWRGAPLGDCGYRYYKASFNRSDQRGSAAIQSGDKSHALHTQAPGKIFAEFDDFKV